MIWGYPYFRKPPYLAIPHLVISQPLPSPTPPREPNRGTQCVAGAGAASEISKQRLIASWYINKHSLLSITCNYLQHLMTNVDLVICLIGDGAFFSGWNLHRCNSKKKKRPRFPKLALGSSRLPGRLRPGWSRETSPSGSNLAMIGVIGVWNLYLQVAIM